MEDISNSKRKKQPDDAQLQILEEVKKTNASLSQFASRLDAVETRLKNVEHQQIASSSSAESSAEKVKRTVPARVRVSTFSFGYNM